MKTWLKGGLITAIIYLLIKIILYLLDGLTGYTTMYLISELISVLILGFVAGSIIGLILNSNKKIWLKGGFIGIVILVTAPFIYATDFLIALFKGRLSINEIGGAYVPIILLIFLGLAVAGFIIGAIIGAIIQKTRNN